MGKYRTRNNRALEPQRKETSIMKIEIKKGEYLFCGAILCEGDYSFTDEKTGKLIEGHSKKLKCTFLSQPDLKKKKNVVSSNGYEAFNVDIKLNVEGVDIKDYFPKEVSEYIGSTCYIRVRQIRRRR